MYNAIFNLIAAMFLTIFASWLYYSAWLVEKEKYRNQVPWFLVGLAIIASVFFGVGIIIWPIISAAPLHYVIILTLCLVVLRIRFPSCTNNKLDGPHTFDQSLSYYVFDDKGKVVNAWYNKGKIIVSRSLLNCLNKSELHAVLLHEKGHKDTRILLVITTILTALWMFMVAAILVLWFFSISYRVEGTILVVFLLAGYTTTAPILAVSWICEHIGDDNVLKHGLVKDFVAALIKINIFNEVYHETDDKVKVITKVDVNFVECQEIKSLTILYEFLKAVIFSVPVDIFCFLKKPLYITHPPLKIRVCYLCKRVSIK